MLLVVEAEVVALLVLPIPELSDLVHRAEVLQPSEEWPVEEELDAVHQALTRAAEVLAVYKDKEQLQVVVVEVAQEEDEVVQVQLSRQALNLHRGTYLTRHLRSSFQPNHHRETFSRCLQNHRCQDKRLKSP